MGINFNKVLINLDTYTSYVPVLSTVTNLVDLMLKAIFRGKEAPPLSYRHHIQNKRVQDCVLLLIPVIGNILVPALNSSKKREQALPKKIEEPTTAPKEDAKSQLLLGKFASLFTSCAESQAYPIEDQKKAYQEAAEIWENLAKVQTDKTMRSYYEGNRLLNLGKCYFISGSYTEALKYLKEADKIYASISLVWDDAEFSKVANMLFQCAEKMKLDVTTPLPKGRGF